MLGRMDSLQAGVGELMHLPALVGAEEERLYASSWAPWPLRSTSACSRWVTQQPKEGSGNLAACLGFKCSAIGTVLHLGHRDPGPSQKDSPCK